MSNAASTRADHEIIINAVPQGARVLDVGCGDGLLLHRLKQERNAVVRGMELSQAGVNACVAKGLSVVQGDADLDLALYPDDSFDIVVLSRTIQATRKPEMVLKQMHRIGAKAVVSLPNFGFWQVRLSLLLNGRMPVTQGLPDSWHETENLHLCTLLDFDDLAKQSGFDLESVTRIAAGKASAPSRATSSLLNWLSEEAVFVLKRAGMTAR
ncbi:MAG: methionine biosynthesis protein MetW [Aquidulcibacter sp.]|jgi:methionine biosynthesis protein MetW|uniref:methionine biosynthesis protein MetW n=1 Tax=Aquidulcibacter sp. TaxID=2052990 RepID=UPI0022CAFA54|nr:methionine biosynthesis protein MetW [Aquidulcibacter sp.]